MYAKYGLDPERIRFTQDLANLMAGHKFQQRSLQNALQGNAGLFGDSDVLSDPGDPSGMGGLGSYA
jgi:hypothetical protein